MDTAEVLAQLRAIEIAMRRGTGYQVQAGELDAAIAALEDMRARKDGAYGERTMVVALLARRFPSGIRRTAIEGWSGDWHGCVYIDLPTGQASWHYHYSQEHLFIGLPAYTKEYDGHTTGEKYSRLIGALLIPPAALSPQAATLDHVATIAHSGGLAELGWHDALVAIRRLTLPHWDKRGGQLRQIGRVDDALAATPQPDHAAAAAPLDMVLHCPACHHQHIDAPEAGRLISGGSNAGRAVAPWQNPPHRSHLCHRCGYVWRPADVCTNGVVSVKTAGKNDTPV